mmetsp:Transcript_34506/g.103162  ORF Transcript_34506/g.103162 Transcript_34506/m.103162 type:complete len:330 (-) Transcript_34506:128-1117(-)
MQQSRSHVVHSAIAKVSGTDVLANPDSPQSKALQWILEDDHLQIDPRQRVATNHVSNNGKEPSLAPEDTKAHLIQRYVISVLYFATGGPNWTEHLNFLSGESECSWKRLTKRGWYTGITCDAISSHITEISLANKSLHGILPYRELSSLPFLREIWVYNNFLGGTFPSSEQRIFELPNLQRLSIANNFFTGVLPRQPWENLANLVTLELQGNSFDGSIPSALGTDLPFLEELDVHSNPGIIGSIPSELGQLNFLRKLDLSMTGLTGIVPVEVCKLSRNVKWFMQVDCDVGTIVSEAKVECSCCTNCCNDTQCCPVPGLERYKIGECVML